MAKVPEWFGRPNGSGVRMAQGVRMARCVRKGRVSGRGADVVKARVRNFAFTFT